MFKDRMLLTTLDGGGGTAVNGGTVAVGFFGWRYDGGGILLDGGTTAVGFFWMAVRTLASSRLSQHLLPGPPASGLCWYVMDPMAIGRK